MYWLSGVLGGDVPVWSGGPARCAVPRRTSVTELEKTAVVLESASAVKLVPELLTKPTEGRCSHKGTHYRAVMAEGLAFIVKPTFNEDMRE